MGGVSYSSGLGPRQRDLEPPPPPRAHVKPLDPDWKQKAVAAAAALAAGAASNGSNGSNAGRGARTHAGPGMAAAASAWAGGSIPAAPGRGFPPPPPPVGGGGAMAVGRGSGLTQPAWKQNQALAHAFHQAAGAAGGIGAGPAVQAVDGDAVRAEMEAAGGTGAGSGGGAAGVQDAAQAAAAFLGGLFGSGGGGGGDGGASGGGAGNSGDLGGGEAVGAKRKSRWG